MREITGTASNLLFEEDGRLLLALSGAGSFVIAGKACNPMHLLRWVENDAEITLTIEARLLDDLSAVVVVTSIRAVETTETGQ